MRSDSELMVITKAKDLINYSFKISENAPKKFRFTLITKLHNLTLDVLESLILANEIPVGKTTAEDKKRRSYQQMAIAKLKMIDALAMIAREQKCILPKQYETLSKNVDECIRLTGAWINSDKKRSVSMGI